jgi:hypothetical protein
MDRLIAYGLDQFLRECLSLQGGTITMTMTAEQRAEIEDLAVRLARVGERFTPTG